MGRYRKCLGLPTPLGKKDIGEILPGAHTQDPAVEGQRGIPVALTERTPVGETLENEAYFTYPVPAAPEKIFPRLLKLTCSTPLSEVTPAILEYRGSSLIEVPVSR